MTPAALDIAIEIVAILIMLFIILRTAPLLKTGKNTMAAALFLFATCSQMLSIAYWLAYSLTRPETRMPFAANEIGEIAWFLLLASALKAVLPNEGFHRTKETVFTLVFTAASVALWIGWSGEWVQDIICGIAFGYLLVICVRALKQTCALSNPEWCILGISCAVIIIAQTGTFFVPEIVKQPLDIFCYVLMFTVLILLVVKSILMIKQIKKVKRNSGEEDASSGDTRSDAKPALATSFAATAFSFSTMYMSSGGFYYAALTITFVTLSLMLITLKMEIMR